MPIVPETIIDPGIIIIDYDIYPRKDLDQDNIDDLVGVLDSGNEFKDKIEVQRVIDDIDDDDVKTILIDGAHRLQAYKEFRLSKIEVVYFNDDVLNKEEHLWELKERSFILNQVHGLKLDQMDVKKFLRDYCKAHPNITQDDLALKARVSQATVSGWVKDIFDERKATKKGEILKLSRLGYNQTRIAKKVSLSQSRVSEIIGNIESDKTDIFRMYKKQKGDYFEIPERLGLDEGFFWSIILEKKDDIERFVTTEKEKPQSGDIWNPSSLKINLIYYYTKQGQLIVDLSNDDDTEYASLIMNRKCRLFKNINAFIEEDSKCDMIIFQPFIFDKRTNSIKDPDNHLKNLSDIVKRFHGDTSANHVALLVDNIKSYEYGWMPQYCMRQFTDADFKLERIIIIVKGKGTYTSHNIQNAIEQKKPLPMTMSLMIFTR